MPSKRKRERDRERKTAKEGVREINIETEGERNIIERQKKRRKIEMN